MKKIIALILIAILAFSFGAAAFAEEKTETWDKMGFTLTYPEEFSNLKGILLPNPYPSVKDVGNIGADQDAADGAVKVLQYVKRRPGAGVSPVRGAAELADVIGLGDNKVESLTLVGENGDIRYYAVTAPEMYEDFAKKIPPEYAEEYLSLQAAMVDVMKNARYFTPRSTSADLLGTVLQFETTDLDGNAVRPMQSRDAGARRPCPPPSGGWQGCSHRRYLS